MMAFVLLRNRKKEGVLFGSLKGDPYAITEYKGDTKGENPVKDKINLMCAIYPEKYADPAPKDEKKKAQKAQDKQEQAQNTRENGKDREKKD